MESFDTIIVGGGPAGAACAARLRERGRDCLVLDKADFPREKLCAGWITPRGLRHACAADAYPHALARFERFAIAWRGRSFALRTRQYAIRRLEFDDWLLRRAGVERRRHEVRRVERATQGFVLDRAFRCRVLVGAGGTHCPVYRALFADWRPRRAADRVDAIEEEFSAAWTDPHCRLWFCDDGLPGYAWYVPKPGGIVNVGIGGLAGRLRARGASILPHWRAFTARLELAGLVRGHAFAHRGHSYYLRGPDDVASCDGAYLVGDAAGVATRDLGEGIAAAIESGQRAAEAICRGRALTLRGIPRYSLPGMVWAGCGRGR